MTRRDPSRFLKSIPDSVPLSSLMLPGTHDTMAFYGWPITQCQSPTNALDIQLNSGIRVLDIRLAIIESRLISYHGVVSQRTSFADILRQLHAFLTAPSTCSETVVVSIKQEDQDPPLFSRLVREEIMTSPGGIDMWYLENRIPNLGEVRGKAVMFSRFGGNGYGWKDCAIGIHPPLWPDSPRLCFSWDCGNTLVQTQDWYAIPSFLWIPEKAAISTEILIPLGDCPDPVLSITFLSASSVPLALPPVIAQGFGWPKCMVGFEGVNSRVGRWLLERLIGPSQEERKGDVGPRIRGWALMDFFEVPEGLVPLFIECNFRGRRVGEEGWF
ncbi:PLC-like phosphodiesterase [Scleroderma citrinum]